MTKKNIIDFIKYFIIFMIGPSVVIYIIYTTRYQKDDPIEEEPVYYVQTEKYPVDKYTKSKNLINESISSLINKLIDDSEE